MDKRSKISPHLSLAMQCSTGWSENSSMTFQFLIVHFQMEVNLPIVVIILKCNLIQEDKEKDLCEWVKESAEVVHLQ